jgi:hypothetical protein
VRVTIRTLPHRTEIDNPVRPGAAIANVTMISARRPGALDHSPYEDRIIDGQGFTLTNPA